MQNSSNSPTNEDPRFRQINLKGVNNLKWSLHPLKPDSEAFPMSVASMDFPLCQQIRTRIIQKISKVQLGYPICPPSLRQCVANWLKSHHNCTIKPDQVVEASGLAQFYALTLNIYTKLEQAVVMLTPSYYVFLKTTKLENRKCYQSRLLVKEGRFYINFQELEEMMGREEVKLLVLVSPHNPTGRIWSKEEMDKISNIILKTGKTLMSNQLYSDMAYSQFHSFLQYSQTLKHQLVVCNSPSKTFNVSGSSTGYGIFHCQQAISRYHQLQFYKTCNFVTAFSSATLEACYDAGEEWRLATKDYLQENYRFFVKQLVDTKLEIFQLEAGYLVLTDFRNYGLGGKEVNAMLNDNNIWLTSMKTFFVSGEETTLMRVNIACNRSYLGRFLQRLRKVLKEMEDVKGKDNKQVGKE